MVEHDKAECAIIAKRWGEEYWDGLRQYGYGGYKYDGRWLPIAQDIAKRYDLEPGNKVLDVGCGKAFLLYEFTRAVPGGGSSFFGDIVGVGVAVGACALLAVNSAADASTARACATGFFTRNQMA